MQSQGMTSKTAVKVSKRQGFESRKKEDQVCTQYDNSSSRRI